MSMRIIIKDGVSPELERMARQVANRRPILEAMGQSLVSQTKQAFMNEAVRVAVWPPLKPATIKRKGGKGGILRGANAVMMRSIAARVINNSEVVVSTDRPYAVYHQFGTKRGLPPRPFFPFVAGRLTQEARQKIERVAMAKIRAMLAGR